jgi:hypothetical protein
LCVDDPSSSAPASSSPPQNIEIDRRALNNGIECVYLQDKKGQLVINPTTGRPAMICSIPTDKYAINKILEIFSAGREGNSSLQLSDTNVSCDTCK